MGTFQDANGQGIFTVPGDLDAYMASRGHILLEVNLVGPLWCPDHDRQRLDRVSASLEAIAGGLSHG